jgi:two-component system, cell cycle response regulator
MLTDEEMEIMFMETTCNSGNQGCKNGNPPVWLAKIRQNETRSLQREVAGLGFLAQFAREVSASLNPQDVVLSAAKLLFNYFRYNFAVFSLPADSGGLTAFSPLEASGCRSSLLMAAEQFPGLTYSRINDYRFLDLSTPLQEKDSGDYPIVLDLTDHSGSITLYCGEDTTGQIRQDFLTVVAESLTAALRNAREHDRVKELSVRDALTGLYNRRVLEEILSLEENKRTPGSFAILLIDLDDFKVINDTFGHPAGDRVLSVLGKILLENSRKENIVARYGGEEFAVLLTNTGLSVALQVAERLRIKLCEQDFAFSGRKVRLTVSIGVAHNEGNSAVMESLLARADQALYQAKRNGKNRVCFHKTADVEELSTKRARSGKRPAVIKFGSATVA